MKVHTKDICEECHGEGLVEEYCHMCLGTGDGVNGYCCHCHGHGTAVYLCPACTPKPKSNAKVN